MSTFVTRIAEARNAKNASDDKWQKFKADYPELAGAILGVKNDQGGYEAWPHTLMVYVSDGRLKWSLNCKQTKQTTFGCFPDLNLVLDDVERHLVEGKFEVASKRG